MKQVETRDAQTVAVQILDTAPLVMRALRVQLRTSGQETMSIPQFHALVFVRNHPGTGLSELADFLGATLPTMSELVNRLVGSGLMERTQNPHERRRIQLSLTPDGEAVLQSSIDQARAQLAELLAPLPAGDLEQMADAFAKLHEVLAPVSRQT